jgi:hypothetical protein
LTTEASSNLKRWRGNLSGLGYVLVSCSVLVVVALWSRTCALGGFHCFDGDSGHAVAAAQIGVIFGLICSLFGRGTKRLLFAGIAFFELVFCYSQTLVH